ncbi:cytochrome P450 [Streptomonospora wellingtoniae]|uniref:Cytochrome P450 n=1 Tax=Streptomonospora wellingtoniae TaxID=3075544 RepID=A0ABU2L0W9_9ACTN|nr:cytochrome P450 [Streptomonospora sp. DSM 45055]MDT0305207.1 cytochrome P450 [Streptomonospora sp. DSM 45055]
MTAQPADALPITRTCPYAPPDEHRRLRAEAPVSRVTLPTGATAWALTRHEDIRAMLVDPRFSSDRRKPGFPALIKGQRLDTAAPLSLVSMDPPQHGPARRAVVGEFTVKRMARLRPRVQEIVDERIDAMIAGPRPTDLVAALSLPVPSLVICELLGVPYADHVFFEDRSARLLSRTASQQERMSALGELRGYLADLIRAKEKKPADDLLSRQLATSEDREELIGLATLLLLAGHETTANMISLGTMSLLERPDDVRAIVEDPAKAPAAVEELLRYFTIAEFVTSRVAVADVEIGGVLIREGEGVVTLANTADRDPEVFDRPDEIDIERGGRNHLAFGFGPHQCLGQNLARMELEIVFTTLFARMPGLRPAVARDELPFKDDASLYGIHEFPVTW